MTTSFLSSHSVPLYPAQHFTWQPVHDPSELCFTAMATGLSPNPPRRTLEININRYKLQRKQCTSLGRLGQDLDVLPPDHCVPLHDDSQACIRIAGNPCLAERTKHFDVKYHWLREKVKANKVELRYISTHDQLADIFTKPLGVMQHNYLKGRLTGFR